jgi:hypothetical protein
MTSPQSPDHPENSDRPEGSRGQHAPRRALILTGVGGALVGAVIVGAIWLGTSLSSDADPGAAADADVACQILDRVPTVTMETFDQPYVDRVKAASEMASVAAEVDARYRSLADQTEDAAQLAVTFDVKRVNETIQAARETCDEL